MRTFSDPRLRYFRHPYNIEPNKNYNFCLEKVNGSYFLLLHDDDVIDSDFVRTCINAAMNKPDIGVIRTGVRVIATEGTGLGQRRSQAQGFPLENFLERRKITILSCQYFF